MPFFPSFYARGGLHVAVTMEENGGGRPSEINRNARQKGGTLNTIRVMEKNIPPKCRHQRAAIETPPLGSGLRQRKRTTKPPSRATSNEGVMRRPESEEGDAMATSRAPAQLRTARAAAERPPISPRG